MGTTTSTGGSFSSVLFSPQPLLLALLSLLSSSPRTMRAAEENFSPPAYLSLSELLLRPSGLPATSYSFTRRIPLSLEMMVMVEEEKKEDDMMMEEKPKEDDMMEEMMEPM